MGAPTTRKRRVRHPEKSGPGGAEAGDFGGKVAELLLEFGQVIEDRDGFEPIFVVDGWVAGVERAGGNVTRNAALRSDDGTVTDREMAGDADLAGEDAIFADLRGTGEADLATEQSILADFRGVTYLN